ncbi:MAG: hypothetical protein G01um101470_531 [Parcubacteria group bacterium Gr01-1014_70]|nr:MAG: hypothetical protein G01um101470_531 [Parcubacteria group bacterium Gr01-1014_70]
MKSTMTMMHHEARLISFVERFKQPLPSWYKGIKEEAYKRITEAPFADACRKGDREVMKKLIINLWPFVDIFPQTVGRIYAYLFTNPVMYFRHGFLNMLSLSYDSVVFLKSIARDEKSHRLLWLDSGLAFGLQYPKDYGYSITPQTQVWKDEVMNRTELSEMFLGYVAIEIIAESISKNLVNSDPFKLVLGDRGIRWFAVHTIDHGDVSHENLELHLACAFHPQPEMLTRETAEHSIMSVVDKFLAAANACI